ncbi:hypothetical protein NP493_12g10005 [Ridgeia piscesae]|uniref:Uncharacterized protein n=1 Tax=Ridgeia piscesae TaxID=27915 RepID=A0AAD9PEW5_RIDPI|nr:hypothetical protein NP493_12g10005 [Ridgeia piscesae]
MLTASGPRASGRGGDRVPITCRRLHLDSKVWRQNRGRRAAECRGGPRAGRPPELSTHPPNATRLSTSPNAAVTSGTEGIICSQEQATVLGATAFIRTITDGIYDPLRAAATEASVGRQAAGSELHPTGSGSIMPGCSDPAGSGRRTLWSTLDNR